MTLRLLAESLIPDRSSALVHSLEWHEGPLPGTTSLHPSLVLPCCRCEGALRLQGIGKDDLDEAEESAYWRRRYTLRPGLASGSHDVPSFLAPLKYLVLETGLPLPCRRGSHTILLRACSLGRRTPILGFNAS